MTILLAAIELLVVLVSSTAHADDGLRCAGGKLVNVGDRMYEVRALCGEPDDVFHRVERHVQIDEWTYDLGPNTFIRTVIFKNARVFDIVAGHYGHKSS